MEVDHEYAAQELDKDPEDDDDDDEYYTEDEDDREEFPEMISHGGQEYGGSVAQRVYTIMSSTNRCVPSFVLYNVFFILLIFS